MEPPIRDQIHDFTRACKALAGFAHAQTGLTDVERETVRQAVLELEQQIGPSASQSSMDDTPAATLSNMPPIDWPTGRWSGNDKDAGG
jgi:hypothetical protein